MPLVKHPVDKDARSAALVDVWTWSLDVDPAEQAVLAQLLSDDEQRRAARFAKARDRLRWVAARGRMRQILGRVLQRDPAGLSFTKEALGRPLLAADGVEGPSFSLSHSHQMGALAISSDARVGVDIEAVRPMADDEMAAALSEREWTMVRGLDVDVRLAFFFRLWTLKEAFIKALGTGVSTPLASFDIHLAANGEAHLARWDADPAALGLWRFASVEPVLGYAGAVAALAGEQGVKFSWREEMG